MKKITFPIMLAASISLPALLSGCIATHKYSELSYKSITPPIDGMAKIVFIRRMSPVAIVRSYAVHIDRKYICAITASGYCITEVEPGFRSADVDLGGVTFWNEFYPNKTYILEMCFFPCVDSWWSGRSTLKDLPSTPIGGLSSTMATAKARGKPLVVMRFGSGMIIREVSPDKAKDIFRP